MQKNKKFVIKIGTNVITQDNGLLDVSIMESIIRQVVELKKHAIDIVIVSSGAMGAGRSLLSLDDTLNTITRRQRLAAVGQVKLMSTYSDILQKYGLLCAQVLATKQDFHTRAHYLNMKNCMEALVHDNIIPIVNENDVVSVDELMFTDNDELAGLIATMLNVDALVLLTNVDGIFDRHPSQDGAQLIHCIHPSDTLDIQISSEKSLFGRGGMMTKCGVAEKLAKLGIATYIGNGKKDHSLIDIMKDSFQGTVFEAHKEVSNIKRWVAHARGQEKAIVMLKDDAIQLLSDESIARSLLPIGICEIHGDFEKGDIIKLQNMKRQDVGFGIANYSSQEAEMYKGKKDQKYLIHYDYLYIF